MTDTKPNEPPEPTSGRDNHLSNSELRQQIQEAIDHPSVDGALLADLSATLALLANLWLPADSLPEPTEADEQAQLPKAIGRFQVERILGWGGFGVVLLAVDPDLKRQVAIKIPRPEIVFSRKLREAFVREAELVAQLDCDGIVPIYEAVQLDLLCFIVSAYVPGPTLADWAKQQYGRLAPRVAAQILMRLSEAVQYAHSKGILHRDLKPANVILEPNSGDPLGFRVKLTDFGLAKRVDGSSRLSSHGDLVGTPEYMSPEQAAARTRDIGTQTDVYGLGVILFELLSGAPPLVGENREATLRLIQESEPPQARLSEAGVPLDLQAVCLKCLAKSPADRYQSAAEVAADLRRFFAGEPVLARSLGRAATTWRWIRRRPVLSGLTLAFVAASLTAFWQWRMAALRATQLERSLIEAEQSQVNWGWVHDESQEFPVSHNATSIASRQRLRAHYARLLALHSTSDPTPMFLATASSYQARIAELDNELPAALAGYEDSLRRWRAMLVENPQDPQVLRGIAENLYSYGMLLHDSGQREHPLAELDGKPEHLEALLKEDCGRGLVCAEYARLLKERGEALTHLGEHDLAVDKYEAANRLWTELMADKYALPESRIEATRAAFLWVASMDRLGRANLAADNLFLASRIALQMANERPQDEPWQLLCAQIHQFLAADARDTRKHDLALCAYEDARRALDRIPQPRLSDPTNANLLGSVLRNLAKLHEQAGARQQAMETLQQATALCDGLLQKNQLSRENLGELGFAHQMLGELYREAGNAEQALAHYGQACCVFDRTVGKATKVRQGRNAWAECHVAQAEILSASREPDKAAAEYRSAIEVLERLLKYNPDDNDVLERIAALREKAGVVAEVAR